MIFKKLSHKLKEKKGFYGFLKWIKEALYKDPLYNRLWPLINYHFRPSREVIKHINGYKMILDLSDSGISRDLFLYGIREPECTKIFWNEMREGMHILEIGANIGYYVLLEQKKLDGTGRIYAVEPNPLSYFFLQRNVNLNSFKTPVEFYNIALSDSPGKIEFALFQKSNFSKLYYKECETEKSFKKIISVITTTADELLKDKPVDYIRMDTEGAEILILKGMKNLLNTDRPLKMFAELHPNLIPCYGQTIAEVVNILADERFRVKFIILSLFPRTVKIPYVYNKGPIEMALYINLPLESCLAMKHISDILLPAPGTLSYEGYTLFLER